MFPLTIYWVHSSCAQILKMINRMGQNKKINGPIKTLKASSHCSLYCMSSFCGVRGQWLLQRTLRPPRSLLEFVLPLWLHTFLAALQWTSFFLFVPCRWFTVVRGEVCVFSQACVKVAAQGGKQCVCVGGVQVGLIMHRQQWLQWSSEDDLRTVRLCDVSVGSSRDREEQAHAETICQLQILWQSFS